MSWARLDDGCYFHAKVVAAGNEGFGCFCRLLAWSSHHLTDGEIPATVALAIAGDAHVLDRLCDVGMLSKTDAGYVVHDYLDYNPSARDVRKQRESQRKQRSIAGRASATARQRARNGAVEQPCNENPTPTRTRTHTQDLTTNRSSQIGGSGDTPGQRLQRVLSDSGLATAVSSSQIRRFGDLGEVTDTELAYAADETCKANQESRLKKPVEYFLSVIEGDRDRAARTKRRRDDRADDSDFVPPYLRPENNWSLQERLARERESQQATAPAEVEP